MELVTGSEPFISLKSPSVQSTELKIIAHKKNDLLKNMRTILVSKMQNYNISPFVVQRTIM